MGLKVNVSSFRRIGDDHDKSFTVFCIDVLSDGRRYTVERRYSEFCELHKQLKKLIPTPTFPAKTVLNSSPKLLEHRRQLFEIYLQTIINEGCRLACLLEFLEIGTYERTVSSESLDQLCNGGHVTALNQPMIALSEDMYLVESSRGTLPDTVTTGVLQGFYSSSHSSSVSED